MAVLAALAAREVTTVLPRRGLLVRPRDAQRRVVGLLNEVAFQTFEFVSHAGMIARGARVPHASENLTKSKRDLSVSRKITFSTSLTVSNFIPFWACTMARPIQYDNTSPEATI